MGHDCSHQSAVWVILSLPRMRVVGALRTLMMKFLAVTSLGEPEAQKVPFGFATTASCRASRRGLFLLQGHGGSPGHTGRPRRCGRVVEHCFGLGEPDEVDGVVGIDDVGIGVIWVCPDCGERCAVTRKTIMNEVEDRGGAVDVLRRVTPQDAGADQVLEGGPEPVIFGAVGGCLVEDGREFWDELERHRVVGGQVDADDRVDQLVPVGRCDGRSCSRGGGRNLGGLIVARR